MIRSKETFLNQEYVEPNDIQPGQLCYIGAGYNTSYEFQGLDKAPNSIRSISQRYANGVGPAKPLMVFNPTRGYILHDCNIVDCGDANGFVDMDHGFPKIISTIVQKNGIPIIVGGDHGITIHALKGLELSTPVTVYQFDAHGDYLNYDAGFPHGSVMRAVRGLKYVDRIVHIGLHGNLNTGPGLEDSLSDGNTILTLDKIRENGLNSLDGIIISGQFSYVSFDMDFLDPSIAPAVGVPEPDGANFRMARLLLEKIALQTHVIGADFTEYNPTLEKYEITGLHLTNLLMEFMSSLSRQQ
ncbi:MAG: arginase family protein [archaeon]